MSSNNLADKCPPGYINVNGKCVLRTQRLYESIFGEPFLTPETDDIPYDPSVDNQTEDDDITYDLVDDDDDDTPVEPVVPPPDDTPVAPAEPRTPAERPDVPDHNVVVPAANPQVRRKPEKGNAANNLIKGVVFSASTPDYDAITPIDNKRKPKPYHEQGSHASQGDAVYDDSPAKGYSAADITAIAGTGAGVVAGGAGVGLLAGTSETALPEVGEGGIEMMEIGEGTALLAEQTAAAAAAATGESAAAAAASTAAAEAAAVTGGAAAAEGVGLLGGGAAAAAATGVGEAAVVGGATAATEGLVAGLTAAALGSGAETAGVGLVVLGGAALAVAGGAAIYDHSEEIGNSFNDLGNEISKKWDNTWDNIF